MKKEERLIQLRKIKRKPNSTKKYFDKVEEKAIVDYINAKDDFKLKDKIFTEFLYEPFLEIVNNMVNTYKFGYLTNLDERKLDCVRDMTEKIYMFKPEYESKAFSYFSVIAKNWWLHEVKKNQREVAERGDFDTVSSLNAEEDLGGVEAIFDTVRSPEEEYSDNEQWKIFLEETITQWGEVIRKNTYLYKVFVGICVFLNSSNRYSVSSFNRKALVEFVSAYTGLEKHQVINSLYRLRRNYRLFLDEGICDDCNLGSC